MDVIGEASRQQAADQFRRRADAQGVRCLLYTSDAADERSSVDLGGRRIIKKKNTVERAGKPHVNE